MTRVILPVPHLDDTIVAHEPKAKYDSIAAEETPTNYRGSVYDFA